jgi:hypothetical protein
MLANAIRRPSGDHVGWRSERWLFVACRMTLPSAARMKISGSWSLSAIAEIAIRRPSGDQAAPWTSLIPAGSRSR